MLFQILDKLRLVDVIQKVKPAHVLNRGVGHRNSHLDEMIDHLQGGFEGIQFERSAEHSNFNRIRIREIDRRVAPGAGILRVVYLLGRGEADTIPRRPAVHLALCTAAEAQQLCPEFFDEVQQASNR